MEIEIGQVVQQGDVLLQRVDADFGRNTYAEAAEKDPRINEFVIAYGEVTGHHHVVRGGEVLVLKAKRGDSLVVKVLSDYAELAHIDTSGEYTGDHAAIQLPKGTYLWRGLQREYVEEGRSSRAVFD